MQQKAAKAEENCLRRRQSLPAVPAALLMPGRPGSKGNLLKSIDKWSGVAGSDIQGNYNLSGVVHKPCCLGSASGGQGGCCRTPNWMPGKRKVEQRFNVLGAPEGGNVGNLVRSDEMRG